MTHHHHPRAWRLILAKLHDDHHAENLIACEHNNCADCWAATADRLGEVVATMLVFKTDGDLAAATAIAETETALDLEAADRDAKGLPITAEWITKCVYGHSWLDNPPEGDNAA